MTDAGIDHPGRHAASAMGNLYLMAHLDAAYTRLLLLRQGVGGSDMSDKIDHWGPGADWERVATALARIAVPGGWLYLYREPGAFISMVFVPMPTSEPSPKKYSDSYASWMSAHR